MSAGQVVIVEVAPHWWQPWCPDCERAVGRSKWHREASLSLFLTELAHHREAAHRVHGAGGPR